MRRMIFHCPVKNEGNPDASQLRPLKMIEAFRQIGYDVAVVYGDGAERKKSIASIKRSIRDGVKYDFLYSESSTLPTLCTESHHLPSYPFLDFAFFSFCRRHGIRVGLFYRDIYWRFSFGNEKWKMKLLKPLYIYDLIMYRRLVDVLFLPSKEMLGYIPFGFPGRVEELPPGARKLSFSEIDMSGQGLNLLYIGGLVPHYDLRTLVKAVSEIPEITFTLCCRKDEWKRVGHIYDGLISDNIRVVHKSGDEIDDLYREADLFCIYVKTHEYWKFAVPFKLFESVGQGCPILASDGTWTADFVSREGIGPVCRYDADELVRLLKELAGNREKLMEYRKRVLDMAPEHTWQMRCRKVAQVLL